ncbi:hypothetical protein D3C85_867330 [compost metagenome]
MVVGHEAGHALFLVDRAQHLHEVVGGVGEREARLLQQVEARRCGEQRLGGPGNSVKLAVLAGLRRAGAGQEVVQVPVGAGEVGVADVVVQRREPARVDPAARVDEGDVDHVVGRTARGQLQVNALVVDGEGGRIEVHLGARERLELGQPLLQQLGVGRAEGRHVQRDAGEFLRAALRRGEA